MQPHAITTQRVCQVCGKPVPRAGYAFCSRLCYAAAPRTRRPLAERFWAKVQKADGDACWLWTGARSGDGYGSINIGGADGKALGAHRVAWELTHGPVPEGREVRHRCDNPGCCRPDHLELGSHRDNVQDMLDRNRHMTLTKPDTVRRGEQHHAARLLPAQVLAIRERAARGDTSQAQLAREFGISPAAVSDVVKRRRWQHLP